MRTSSLGTLAALLLAAAAHAVPVDPGSIQRVQRLPPEVVSLRTEIEKELAVLESFVRTLEDYSKEYPRTDDFETLARARGYPHGQAVEKLSNIPELLNRLDGLCAALQMRTAMILIDRGLYAKAHFKGGQVKTAAQDYFLNNPEWRIGITDFNELRQGFPSKVNQRLAAARKGVEAEEAAFRRADSSHESLKQTWRLGSIGGVTVAGLLAFAVLRRRV